MSSFTGKPTKGLTIATWIWLEDINEPTHQLFVTIDPGWTNPRYKSVYDFAIADGGAIQFSHRNVFGRRTTPVIKPQVWTHIAATYDLQSDLVHLYVNGKEMTSFTRVDRRRSEMLSQDWSEATTAGKFLYTTNRVRYLRGRLDEYYLYPCALAPQQVNSLMDKTCQESRSNCQNYFLLVYSLITPSLAFT